MLNRWIVVGTVALIGLGQSACQEKVMTPSEVEAIETATSAYQAFEKSDCRTVERLTDGDALRGWEFNEMRHSMLLLHAFCRELAGDIDDARDIYRRLVVEAPNSFAADDATERLRILNVSESDPTYARWAAGARERMDPSKPRRKPIDRIPVQFPPLARAVGVEGFAIVEFGVTERGATEDLVVVESSPPLLFDGASVRAIRRWQYEREPNVDPGDRQLIRLLFKPDGQTNAQDDPGATPSSTE